MRPATHFHIGTDVVVNVPEHEHNKMLMKYNGTRHKVTGHKSYQTVYAYTLDGCESKYHVPYWFADDWLREVWVDEK